MIEKAQQTIQWKTAVADIDALQWNRLAREMDTPLLEWEWLHALEASGSICPDTGWYPRHLTLWQGADLVAAAPLYLKTHSEGEFVFDHWWARLAEKVGLAYYPKLIGMSPATPASGYCFLVAEGANRREVARTLTAAIDRFCLENGVHSSHFHFVDQGWVDHLRQCGYTLWNHQAYRWDNAGLDDFEDYLQAFKSNQRRNIRRERARMQSLGIEIRPLRGDAISADLADSMYDCYLNTNAQYGLWAARFLNKNFFQRIFSDFRHRLLVFEAHETARGSMPLALSMLLVKNRQLIGRYWGSRKPVQDLHFNLCFYEPIAWAIANGISWFDPGVGSPHKLQRGIRAVASPSLHRFYNDQMRTLFHHFIPEVNALIQREIDALNRRLPLARTEGRQKII